jgi:RNA polymerase sigma-70 factor (ECF subfamily)
MNQSVTCGAAADAASAGVLGRALAGDDAAFEELLLPLIPPGHRLAYALLRDEAAAEDAVQDACLSAWHRLHQLRSPDSVRAWFLAIVANRCRSAARRRWTLPVHANPDATRRKAGTGGQAGGPLRS